MKRRFLLLAVLISALSFSAHAGEGRIRRGAYAVKNRYIVVLNDAIAEQKVAHVASRIARAYHGRLGSVWRQGVKGFSVEMPAKLAEAMSHDPDIKFVEEVTEVHLSAEPTSFDPAACDWQSISTTCPPASAKSDDRLWHLDRIDQNTPSLDQNHNICSDSSGVVIFVVDSGVIAKHNEFKSSDSASDFSTRVEHSVNVSGDNMGPYGDDPCIGFVHPLVYRGDPEDGERLAAGHGTAVASLAAGRKVGVAKNAAIIPVKISRCDDYASRGWFWDHPYVVGDVVTPVDSSGGRLSGRFLCIQSGTSGASQPSWPATIGQEFDEPNSPSVPKLRWRRISNGDEPNFTSDVLINGLNWIVSPEGTAARAGRPAVATLSTYQLPGTNDAVGGAIDSAIDNIINAGIPVIASANNQAIDACRTVPARHSRSNTQGHSGKVITVGGLMLLNPHVTLRPDDLSGNSATQTKDRVWVCSNNDPITGHDSSQCTTTDEPPRSDYLTEDAYQAALRSWALKATRGSNTGDCVSLFAPAKDITSAATTSGNAYRNRLADGATWVLRPPALRFLHRWPPASPPATSPHITTPRSTTFMTSW